MNQTEIIASRLKEIRERRNLDKQTLVDDLNINYSTYNNWENANREPSAEMLHKLARYHHVSLDYFYGRDAVIEDKNIQSGPLSFVLNEVKKSLSQRDRAVKIRPDLYERLLIDARYDHARVNLLLSRLLYEHYRKIEVEHQRKLEEMEKQEALEEYYLMLERLLQATIKEGNILIAITNRRIGHESSQDYYKLLNYTISRSYRSLELELERNGEKWPISFSKIEDIKFGARGDGHIKTWIYMPGDTWRFYLYFKEENLLAIKDEE